MELKKIKKVLDSAMELANIQTDEQAINFLQEHGLTLAELMELGYQNEWRRAFEDPHKWDDEDDSDY